MAILNQASATIANTSKMTLSAWVQLSTSDDYVPIFEFGDSNTSTYSWPNAVLAAAPRACRIFKYNDPFNGQMIMVWLAGTFGAFTAATVAANYTGDPANSLYTGFIDQVNAGTYTSTISLGAGRQPDFNLTSIIAPGTWFHIFFSVDLSSKDGLVEVAGAIDDPLAGTWADPDHSKLAHFMINGQDFGLGSRDEPEFPTDRGGGNHDAGQGWVRCFVNNAFAAGGVIFSESAPAAFDYGYGKLETPGFQIAANGFELSFPGVSANAAYNPGIRYGDVQVWFDTFVPFNPTNFSKFVTVSDGRGTPTPATVAAAAFGRQTYLFKGGKAAFPTNQGNGGAFDKTGTINDFTPGPSY